MGGILSLTSLACCFTSTACTAGCALCPNCKVWYRTLNLFPSQYRHVAYWYLGLRVHIRASIMILVPGTNKDSHILVPQKVWFRILNLRMLHFTFLHHFITDQGGIFFSLPCWSGSDFYFKANPDPAPHQSDANRRPLNYIHSTSLLWASMALQVPFWASVAVEFWLWCWSRIRIFSIPDQNFFIPDPHQRIEVF